MPKYKFELLKKIVNILLYLKKFKKHRFYIKFKVKDKFVVNKCSTNNFQQNYGWLIG